MLSFTWSNAKDLAEIVAAVGSTLAVGLLVWDRVKPKPLQVSGYLSVRTWEKQPDAEVHIFSEAGERLVLTGIKPSPHFEIALLPKQSPAARKVAPAPLVWTRGWLTIRAIADRGHSGDEPLIRVIMRERADRNPWNRLARWVFRPALITKGLLPYRAKGRFRVGVSTQETNLLQAVRRRSKDSGQR